MEELFENAIRAAAIGAPIVSIIVQAIKNFGVNKRALPFIAMAIGILFMIVIGTALNEDLVTYGLAGLISGAASVGLYEGIVQAKGDY